MKAPRDGQQKEPYESAAHADGERVGARVTIRVESDQGLEQGGTYLKAEGDQADLRETQTEILLQQRIDRRQKGLEHIVEKMRKTQRHQHPHGGTLGICSRLCVLGGRGHA